MFESVADQATGLRRLFRPRRLRLLPVLADGPGAHSADFALNLAVAMAREGLTPLVIDAHPQGVAAYCALNCGWELQDLIDGECRIEQAIRRADAGVSVLGARRALAGLARDPHAAEAVFSALASLRDAYDVAIVHAPGPLMGPWLSQHAGESTLLCGTDEQSLTDAYARIKRMVCEFQVSRFRVVFDACESPALAAERHRRLADAAGRFLEAAVGLGGVLHRDRDREAAREARASVFAVAADGPAARAFSRIASTAHDWLLPVFEPAPQTLQ